METSAYNDCKNISKFNEVIDESLSISTVLGYIDWGNIFRCDKVMVVCIIATLWFPVPTLTGRAYTTLIR